MSTTLLTNTGASLTQTFFSGETTIDATGSVTVAASNLAGVTVAGAATATHVGAANSGAYEWALAAVAAPDLIKVVWSGTFGGVAQSLTSYVEIVGGFYISIYDLRHSDDQMGSAAAAKPISNTTSWPLATLILARQEAENEAMRIMGHSCVARASALRLVSVKGVLHPRFAFLRSVRAATLVIDNTVVSVASWRIEGEDANRIWCGLADGTAVDVIIEHGEDRVLDAISRACLVRARHALARTGSKLPDTTERFTTTEFGTIFLARPGSLSTGNDSVDAIYGAHRTNVGIG